jgi:ubiquinone/menaquinone biosynthesis C-methylase UbiE
MLCLVAVIRQHLEEPIFCAMTDTRATSVSTTSRNYWIEKKCASAFWGQQELPAYRRLLADTLAMANPGPGERWLDLGCGGGALSRGIWESSQGRAAEVVGVDCAAVNEARYQLLRETLSPPPGEKVRFVCQNFSAGLSLFPDASFHHAISGLSISYAESFDEASRTWTAAAYDRLLGEVWRVLRPGGRFVFSVNVPEPSWLKVGWQSLTGVFQSRRPLNYLKKSWRMLHYGSWLKQEARRGRFHYLPAEAVRAKLHAAGYVAIDHRLSYAGQAYVFQATKNR